MAKDKESEGIRVLQIILKWLKTILERTLWDSVGRDSLKRLIERDSLTVAHREHTGKSAEQCQRNRAGNRKNWQLETGNSKLEIETENVH